MTVARVLVTAHLPGDGPARLAAAGHDVTYRDVTSAMPRDELLGAVAGTDALVEALGGEPLPRVRDKARPTLVERDLDWLAASPFCVGVHTSQRSGVQRAVAFICSSVAWFWCG